MKKMPITSPHFNYLLTDFTRWLTILGYSATTIAVYPVYVREFFHFLEAKGHTMTGTVGNKLMAQYRPYLAGRQSQQSHRNTHSPLLSTAALNAHLTALAKLSAYLVAHGQNPLPIPAKREPGDHRPIEVLTTGQVSLLFGATYAYQGSWPLQALRDRAILALLYGCGLRNQEAICLELPHLDIHNRRLLVANGKNNKQRTVPFSKQTAIHLSDYIHTARTQLAKQPKAGKTTRLLLNKWGRQASPALPAQRLRHLANYVPKGSLEQKRVYPHLLRHSIATHLLQAGMSLERVSQLLGHNSLGTTQRYTHLAHEQI